MNKKPKRAVCAAIAAALLMFTVLLFAGCSGAGTKTSGVKVPETVYSEFESNLNITYRELSAQARMAKTAPGYCKVSFTLPESLKDLSFNFTLDEVEISYKGLSFSVPTSDLPDSAIARMIVEALNSATQKDGVTVALDESGLVLTGKIGDSEFLLHLDSKTGNFMSLEVPSEEFKMKFDNFEIIKR